MYQVATVCFIKKTYSIELVLALHVSLDEDDVVYRLLHHEGHPPGGDLHGGGHQLLEPVEDGVEVVLELAVELGAGGEAGRRLVGGRSLGLLVGLRDLCQHVL